MIKVEICNLVTKVITEREFTFDTDIYSWLEYKLPNMMLFIDPSTTSLGMSIAYLDKKAPVYGIGIKRAKGTKEEFVEEYGEFLNELLKCFSIKKVLVENQYIDRRKVNAYAALKLVMGKIEFICKRNRVKMEKILPTVWKGVVLDMYPGYIDKRKSNKQEVKAVMTRILPQTLSIKTTDVFDSLGIMYYYLMYMAVDKSEDRKDLIMMMYCMSNGMDYQEYQGIINSSNEKFIESAGMKEFNDYFYNECDGKIVKVSKNSTKEYRKHFRVGIHKIRVKNKSDFMSKIDTEIRKIKHRDVRGLDYILHDPEISIRDNAMGYMGTQQGRVGIMVMKPNRQILPELFQGRDILGRITKNDYIFIYICV